MAQRVISGQRREVEENMGEEQEVGLDVVQQIANKSNGEPPLRYVRREEDRPVGDAPLASDVPVIDLSRLFQPDGHDEAEKLRSALQSWGLFQAIGHDMSESFLDEVRDVGKKFFQLPMEIKQKYSNLKDGTAYKFEGYGNDHQASEDQILNWNDRLFLLVQPEDKRKLHLWPKNPSSFRDVLHEYTMKLRKVAEQVLSAMAKLLELDENYFIHQLGDRAEVHARFNFYPSCARPDLVFGIVPHSDGSFITILLLDKEVEGLQVLKDGEWLRVPIIPHGLVVNLGNQMEVICNGIFKSPVHRVVVNPVERVSLALFYLLEEDKDLEPAPGLVDETSPRLYKNVKVKEFNEAYFQYNSLGKSALDWLKV